MRIAVIVKKGINDSKVYTTHKTRVTYHEDKVYLSDTDKNALELAVQLKAKNGGFIDAYTFEQGVVADRVLNEAIAMGADDGTKFVGIDASDATKVSQIARVAAKYIKRQGNYDLILTGEDTESNNLIAYIADEMGRYLYDHVATIDENLNATVQLEKGKINYKMKTPAAVSVLSTINTPHLPSFIELRDAMAKSKVAVKLEVKESDNLSKVVADQRKKKQVIFNLNEDPDAVKKLVKSLEEDGILK